MKRVVLLTCRQPDFATSQAIEHLSTGLSGDYQFDHLRLYPGSMLAQIGLARPLRQASSGCQLVHAFGHRAMMLATLLVDAPILYTPLADDPASAVGWVRSAMSRRNLRLLSLSVGEDRLFVSGGVEPSRTHLVRPGVRLGQTLAPDPATRKALGLKPDDIALLAVGESLRSDNHLMAMHTMSILNSIQPRWKMLLWGTASDSDVVRQLHWDWGTDMLVDARNILGNSTTFAQVLVAADLGLITSPQRVSVAPILTCMAHGLPLVAPATPEISEALEDRHTALLYSPTKPRAAAQRVLALYEDPRLQRQLADQSRAEAYELFPISRFLDEVRQIYA